MDFKKLSEDLYYRSSHYRFAKKPTGYDKGYTKIADWLSDLCYYYMQQEKGVQRRHDAEFKELVEAQRQKIQQLPSSEYKQGLLRALEEVSL